jgi:hypothetical protein
MSLLKQLIPVERFKEGFTTCAALLKSQPKLALVNLEDRPLGVHKNASKTPHRLERPPTSKSPSPPETAWMAFYPKGSINPKAPIPGGLGFYMSGPTGFATKLEQGAKEVLLSYRMMFQEDWEWKRGGKLPGVCKSLDHY